jgi:hypothetical protein
VIEPRDEADPVDMGGVAEEYRHHHESEHDSDEMLLHPSVSRQPGGFLVTS